MESNRSEDFRRTIIMRIARCLVGDMERGKRVACYTIPRILASVDLVVNFDLSQLSKAVEFDLNTIAATHTNARLRANYRVKLNTINGTCHFTAHVLST